MRKKLTYTSTLPEDLLIMVNDYSAKYKVSKNAILEKALRNYLFELKKNEFKEGFKKAQGDNDQLTLADSGMDDYWEIINRFEQPKP